ncbi:unnamed protein product [Durusdinium trenchii]|uniref:Secreted protein n=1 Tax=Durusdinium trenchii TaxID=1381693 RepID=A0ABP0R6N5_9DINO
MGRFRFLGNPKGLIYCVFFVWVSSPASSLPVGNPVCRPNEPAREQSVLVFLHSWNRHEAVGSGLLEHFQTKQAGARPRNHDDFRECHFRATSEAASVGVPRRICLAFGPIGRKQGRRATALPLRERV